MGSLPEDFDERLKHLPLRKRRELGRVAEIIFEQFIASAKVKKKEVGVGRVKGNIVRLVLFGSYARGDWVEDRIGGYFSDYDLLVVVDNPIFTKSDYWEQAELRLDQEWLITKRIKTPVEFIVHGYGEVVSELKRGKPFFVDIMRDGITLFDSSRYPIDTTAKIDLSESEMLEEAEGYFDTWYRKSLLSLDLAKYSLNKIKSENDEKQIDLLLRSAAFEAHQATEHIYHCLLLTRSLYSPKLHSLRRLRALSEAYTNSVVAAWPQNLRVYKSRFELLQRAYVEARYSSEYKITPEELIWLFERIEILQKLVKTFCEETLKNKTFTIQHN
ncbi:HEPN domain-containing protein [Bartonella sp. LJL80]